MVLRRLRLGAGKKDGVWLGMAEINMCAVAFKKCRTACLGRDEIAVCTIYGG